MLMNSGYHITIFFKRLSLCLAIIALVSLSRYVYARPFNIAALAGRSDDMIVKEYPQKCDIPDGAYGVWQIPEIETITPLYYGFENEQAHIDADDSAAIIPFRYGYWIGDHAGSITNGGKGIWEMNKVHVDGTAFMVYPDRTERYVCYMVCRAAATGYGYTLNGFGLYPFSAGDIICGSCANQDGSQVYLAFYRYVCDFS